MWSESFPNRSFVRIHDRVFVSTPYFTVLQLALWRRARRVDLVNAETLAAEDARARAELGVEGQPLTAAQLASWDNIARLARATQVLCDFMGTYRYVPAATTIPPAGETPACPLPAYAGIDYQTKPIITPEAFAAYLGEMSRVRGITRARRVTSFALPHSASPMETTLALMLCLPHDMGGFGLPRPVLNHPVPIDPAERGLTSQGTIVADLCWPDQHVIVEYYGWDEHVGMGPSKVAADAARANSLTALGWTVLHATFEQVRSIQGMALLARQVARALGTTLPDASDLELEWRLRLWALLLPRLRHSR